MPATATREASAECTCEVRNQTKIFLESSFFQEKRASALPPPAKIRACNQISDGVCGRNFNRPPPVRFPSLGLIVKYGADVTVVEARTHKMVFDKLSSQVPVPELFGWIVDGGQTFIYMSLVEGDLLQDRWYSLNQTERIGVCEDLRAMVQAWRSLESDSHDHYIGSLGELPLNDVFLRYRPALAGPFLNQHAVEKFQEACGIDMSSESSVVFTHGDLVASNIIISRGPITKVVAIIDWGQAGWYPGYWEYCKARRVELESKHFDKDTQEEWRTRYLPLILDVVDDKTCYEPWLYFVLANI